MRKTQGSLARYLENQISEFYEVLGHPAEYRRHETEVTLDYGLMPSVDELKVQKTIPKSKRKRLD